MPGANQPAAPVSIAAATDEQIKAAANAALVADAARRTEIKATFAKFSTIAGIGEVQSACENDISCSVQDANAKLLAHLGKGASPIAGTHIVMLEGEREKARAGMQSAIMARANLAKDDRANPFRGYSLMDMARECLSAEHVDVRGKSKLEVVAAAFTSTSDFPLLLANVAEKAMLKGYEEAEETFQLWTSIGTLTDFKAGRRVGLNDFPTLLEVKEGAEYKFATVGERGETVQLATYGRKFMLTRQAIINDDLDAFSKIPLGMGRAAIRTVGDLVYAILTSNPTMQDGKALFHSGHNNLPTAAAISTASVDAMRVAMAKQTAGGGALNLKLAKLLVPVALGGTARVVANSEFEVGANNDKTTPNSVRGTFEVIEDARLDTSSSTNWFGCANPAMHDTIEVSYLDGISTPTLEQQGGWDIDGVEFKVRLDAAVKALDHRTLAKNAYAG